MDMNYTTVVKALSEAFEAGEYNIMLDADSYKVSMPAQYPADTRYVRDYIEARGSVSKPSAQLIESLENYMSPEMLKLFIAENTTHPFTRTVFFGLQYILKKYLCKRITPEMVEYAAAQWEAHGEPFDKEMWMYIATDLKGKLPLRIRAVPEGTVVPLLNALVTVENTDPKCGALTTHIETMLLRVWFPITVATLSAQIRSIIKQYLIETADNLDGLNFKHHDFGARGVSSMESAGIGGAAHLAAGSMGTDNMTAIQTLQTYYHVDGMPAYSIPAAEHSTITTWMRSGETYAYLNMLRQFGKPGRTFAVVSDSYNLLEACRIWGTVLKDELIASGSTVVIRPDSGNPKDIVLAVVQELEKYFGTTINSKGYKLLPSCVRVLQGDGITLESIPAILENLKVHGYSTDNIAMGQGGGLLQMVNRDTLQMACKCSEADVGGENRDVYKDPITDSGKRSKRGEQGLYRNLATGELKTMRTNSPDLASNLWEDAMHDVYLNGDLLNECILTEVQARSALY